MASWTTPTTRTTGELITATIWNAMIGPNGNIQYLYDNLVGIAAMSVYQSGTVTVTTSAAISFDTEDYDLGSMHAGGSPTRGTVPTGAGGVYHMGAMIRQHATGTSNATIYFRKNGATQLNRGLLMGAATLNLWSSMTLVVPLVAADYVEVYVAKGDASSWGFGVSTGEAQFNMHRIAA